MQKGTRSFLQGEGFGPGGLKECRARRRARSEQRQPPTGVQQGLTHSLTHSLSLSIFLSLSRSISLCLSLSLSIMSMSLCLFVSPSDHPILILVACPCSSLADNLPSRVGILQGGEGRWSWPLLVISRNYQTKGLNDQCKVRTAAFCWWVFVQDAVVAFLRSSGTDPMHSPSSASHRNAELLAVS